MKDFIRRLVEAKLVWGVIFLLLNGASAVNGLFSFLRNGSPLSLFLALVNGAVVVLLYYVMRKALRNRSFKERFLELNRSLGLNKTEGTALAAELSRLRADDSNPHRLRQLAEVEKAAASVESERVAIEEEIEKLKR